MFFPSMWFLQCFLVRGLHVCVHAHVCGIHTYSLPDVTPCLPFHPTAARLNWLTHSPSPSHPTSPPIAGLPLSVIICSSIPESLGSLLGKAFLSRSLAGDWISWSKLNLQTIQKGMVSPVIAALLL